MSIIDEMTATINEAVRIAHKEDLTGYRCWCETCCFLREQHAASSPEPTEKDK